MKKLLLSLTMIFAAFTMFAAEGSFDFTAPTTLTPTVAAPAIGTSSGVSVNDMTFTNNNVSILFAQNQGSNECRIWAGTKAYDLRMYSTSTFTISVPAGKSISSITFTGADVTKTGANTGTYTASSKSWTSNGVVTQSVVFTNTGTVKINTITVTYDDAVEGTVATPVINPNGGTFYTPVEVSISCATAGATIQYSIDGGEAATYTAPFTISKTSTVMAQASLNGKVSDIAEVDFTISSAKEVANIAAFLASNTTGTATGEILKITNPVNVLYAGVSGTNHYLFVQDATGAMQIYSAGNAFPNAYTTGSVIPAGITGSVSFYGKQPQMLPTLSSFAASTSTVSVEPTAVAASDVTASMINTFIVINDATISAVTTGDKTTYNIAGLPIYSRFSDVKMPEDLTKTYNIAGIVSVYNGTVQIFPTDYNYSTGVGMVEQDGTTITTTVGAINIVAQNDAQALVVNAAGQIVANQAIEAGANTIEMAKGFYIVKVGNKVAKVVVK